MKVVHLFTDGSVDNPSKTGFGACLLINSLSETALLDKLRTKQFENTSSTRLELETFLWALSSIDSNEHRVMAYTDSQNIVNLLDRRARLVENDFKSGKGRKLTNAELYKEFFRLVDLFQITFHKVKGHSPTEMKSDTERIFMYVDKGARKALRKFQSSH